MSWFIGWDSRAATRGTNKVEEVARLSASVTPYVAGTVIGSTVE